MLFLVPGYFRVFVTWNWIQGSYAVSQAHSRPWRHSSHHLWWVEGHSAAWRVYYRYGRPFLMMTMKPWSAIPPVHVPSNIPASCPPRVQVHYKPVNVPHFECCILLTQKKMGNVQCQGPKCLGQNVSTTPSSSLSMLPFYIGIYFHPSTSCSCHWTLLCVTYIFNQPEF